MSVASSLLSQFSDALSELTANSRDFVAAVQTADGCCECSGILWRANAVAVSDQALADAKEYEVKIGGQTAKATLAGRDGGTNVAVLKLERDFPHSPRAASVPKTRSLALVLGAAEDGVAARMALVRSVGPAWESRTMGNRVTSNRSRLAAREGVSGSNVAASGIVAFLGRTSSVMIPRGARALKEMLRDK